MTEKKQYRLLKDLPDHPKGTSFVYDKSRGKYKTELEAINACDPYSCYMAKFVENNPDWFEKVNEECEAMAHPYLCEGERESDGSYAKFTVQGPITNEQYESVWSSIVSALNDTVVEDSGGITLPDDYVDTSEKELYAIDGKGNKFPLSDLYEKKYTQSEVDAIRADEFAKGYYSAKEQVTDYLNLNTKDAVDDDKPNKEHEQDYFDQCVKDFEQPTNDNAFWTDELVIEFAKGAINVQEKHPHEVSLNEGIFHFKKEKQSKQSAPVDTGKEWWEKLGIRFDGLTYYHPDVIGSYSDLSTIMEFLASVRNIPIPSKLMQGENTESPNQQSAPEPSALPTKEWEIVSFVTVPKSPVVTYLPKNPDGTFGHYECIEQDLLASSTHEIHSVRRLSDNVVFSVGDKVEYGAFSLAIADAMKLKETTIASFKINEGNIWAYGDNFFIAPLNHLRKPTPTEPVVEDKPPLSFHWAVQKKTLHLLDGIIYPLSKPEDWEIFSTLEAAEQYILENKPFLSFADLIGVLWDGDKESYKNTVFYRSIEQKVKEKLNK